MNQPKRTRKETRGAIIGMVLGDGSLYQNTFRDGSKKGNFKLSIAHSIRQHDYLKHKKEIVSDLFHYDIPINITTHSAGNGKKYPVVRLQTRVNSRLTFIAKRMYHDRKKRITPWVLENITTEGLALWWMDDGCLHINKRPRTGGFLVWGTYGFPKEDVELFQNWLKDKYNICLRMTQHKKSGGWYLRRGLSEALKLTELIRNYAVPSMAYKLADIGMFTMKPYSLSKDLKCSARPRLMAGDEIVQAV